MENEIIIEDKDCSVIYAYLWDDDTENWVATGDTLTVWENDHKVYFLEGISFYLLYDFSPQLQDTITYYAPINRSLFSSTYVDDDTQETPNELACVVSEIEQVQVESGQFLTRYFTIHITENNCTELGYVLENVGSLSGYITGKACPYVLKGCFGGFVCYRNENVDVYSEDFSCELFTDDQEVKPEAPVNIYPNPFESNLFINVPTHLSPTDIQIYNLQNQLLLTRKFTTDLLIPDLNDGMYILVLLQEEEIVFIHKLIKIYTRRVLIWAKPNSERSAYTVLDGGLDSQTTSTSV